MLKWIPIIFLVLIIFSKCRKAIPEPEVSVHEVIGVWKIIGDTMMVWRESPATQLHITFEYVTPPEEKTTIPQVRFTLIDSSVTLADYNNVDVINSDSEYRLLVPVSFDLISSNSKSKGFKTTKRFFEYYSVHEVYCEEKDSANQLLFEFNNGRDLNRKYKFSTDGIGEAIRRIACK